MDPATIAALAASAAGVIGTFLRVWVQSRVQRQKAREVSRRDLIRCLPPGSRVIDLGERGLMIEIGNGADPELPADDSG